MANPADCGQSSSSWSHTYTSTHSNNPVAYPEPFFSGNGCPHGDAAAGEIEVYCAPNDTDNPACMPNGTATEALPSCSWVCENHTNLTEYDYCDVQPSSDYNPLTVDAILSS